MARRRSALSKKEPNTHALNARTHPVSIRWMVDFDYLSQLSEAEQLWLSAWVDGWYAADFRDDPLDTDLDVRRARYRAKNASNRDVLAYCDHGGMLDRDLDVIGEDQDLELRTPQVLSSPEYKTALVKLREAIDRKPKDQSAIDRAQEALKAITRGFRG